MKGMKGRPARLMGRLAISRQSAKAGWPAERAFHHPTAGQQDKAALAFGPVIHSSRAAFGCPLLGAAVENHGARFPSPYIRQAHEHTQIAHCRFKTPGRQPALRRLVHQFPRR